MWDFFVKVVCERECEDLRQSEAQEVFASSSQEVFLQSEACALHMTRMRRVMTDKTTGFCECLVGKAFLRDTHETFYFVNLSYLIHQVSTYIIYTHIIHI